MTDAKEWVTVKIPERVRDQARDDPRTYGEIMRAGLDGAGESDSVDAAAVMRKLEQLEGAQADTVSKSLELADISNHDVLEQLDTVERAAKEATSAAQSAEQAVNKLAEGRR